MGSTHGECDDGAAERVVKDQLAISAHSTGPARPPAGRLRRPPAASGGLRQPPAAAPEARAPLRRALVRMEHLNALLQRLKQVMRPPIASGAQSGTPPAALGASTQRSQSYAAASSRLRRLLAASGGDLPPLPPEAMWPPAASGGLRPPPAGPSAGADRAEIASWVKERGGGEEGISPHGAACSWLHVV